MCFFILLFIYTLLPSFASVTDSWIEPGRYYYRILTVNAALCINMSTDFPTYITTFPTRFSYPSNHRSGITHPATAANTTATLTGFRKSRANSSNTYADGPRASSYRRTPCAQQIGRAAQINERLSDKARCTADGYKHPCQPMLSGRNRYRRGHQQIYFFFVLLRGLDVDDFAP